MREKQINLDTSAITLRRFDKVIEWLLISLLACMLLAFEAEETWSEEAIAGFLDAEEPQVNASFSKFKKAIQLDSRLVKEMTDIYINHKGRPDLVVTIAGDNADQISHIANILPSSVIKENAAS